ncbi:MAG: succinate dehydrogenase [Bacteroidetes bacterium]|nr:MAG: succinate dehydrogenase [Bacteroidota bacterium]
MGWFGKFLTSSIGQKVIMSLTGLFLIVFLVVHLAGNLQLLIDDGGRQFNLYAKFMTTNPLIKTISYLLYFFILLHAIQGWALWRKNRLARGTQRYAVHRVRAVNTHPRIASRMGWIGTVLFVFLLIHLYQFWLQMKIGALPMVDYDGVLAANLYLPVQEAYTDLGFVIFYVVSMGVVGAHLWHGFQSAFQTLGLNHRKYTPLIQGLGKIYSVVVPLGFAIIPVFFYLGIKF